MLRRPGGQTRMVGWGLSCPAWRHSEMVAMPMPLSVIRMREFAYCTTERRGEVESSNVPGLDPQKQERISFNTVLLVRCLAPQSISLQDFSVRRSFLASLQHGMRLQRCSTCLWGRMEDPVTQRPRRRGWTSEGPPRPHEHSALRPVNQHGGSRPP